MARFQQHLNRKMQKKLNKNQFFLKKGLRTSGLHDMIVLVGMEDIQLNHMGS